MSRDDSLKITRKQATMSVHRDLFDARGVLSIEEVSRGTKTGKKRDVENGKACLTLGIRPCIKILAQMLEFKVPRIGTRIRRRTSFPRAPGRWVTFKQRDLWINYIHEMKGYYEERYKSFLLRPHR